MKCLSWKEIICIWILDETLIRETDSCAADDFSRVKMTNPDSEATYSGQNNFSTKRNLHDDSNIYGQYKKYFFWSEHILCLFKICRFTNEKFFANIIFNEKELKWQGIWKNFIFCTFKYNRGSLTVLVSLFV